MVCVILVCCCMALNSNDWIHDNILNIIFLLIGARQAHICSYSSVLCLRDCFVARMSVGYSESFPETVGKRIPV